ncbi:tRNA dihydrouridine synthase [Campylobacter corcagiensis]|uniref:tRNA-dihydrouridine synthase n=1 Tax=Campylobacter corcagiensis TaxID=1448857 RepID=A0A7M1LEZ3_9BACT|nr:tRNA-dihydrouridine synthase [Campylobacter corcagiensis]QKF65229.1 tRNA-dihydrouridine synthase B [Campylobacter corcagiensis]QOQ86634.1 tRNA-dihydrouridine synthase [Campylobacter corcagiensis]
MIDFSIKPLVLAPLAGYSDLPLRGVVKRFGCDLTISEMISSNALAYSDKKTLKMLEKNELETPFIVQISGNKPDIVKKAVEVLNRYDHIDGIDLNCGCPAKKVVAHGSGSTLLTNLELLKEILDTIKQTSNKRYLSAKIRLGFDEKNGINIARAIESVGVDFISVHGRTKKQGYSGNSDFKAIKEIKQSVKIPIIANGDINSKNAKEVLNFTGADGLMIGRASIGNPWVFYEIKSSKSVSKEIKKEIILAHFDEMMKFYGQKGVALFRKHVHQYAKGYENASEFRDIINRIDDTQIARLKIEEFFSQI